MEDEMPQKSKLLKPSVLEETKKMSNTFSEGFNKPKKSSAIIERNKAKSKTNLCKISKFVHILIFTFLDP